MSFYSIQDQEDRDYEFNARYDYAHEAGYGLGDDPATLAYEMAECAREWDEEMTAAFGPVVVKVEINDEIPF